MIRLSCLALGVSVFCSPAFAAKKKCTTGLVGPGVVTCTLSSGDWSAPVKWDLAGGDLENADTCQDPGAEDHDLSMIVEVSRRDGAWTADVTLLSSKVQDEFTNFAFRWDDGARGVVGREVIAKRRTPDKKRYDVICRVD